MVLEEVCIIYLKTVHLLLIFLQLIFTSRLTRVDFWVQIRGKNKSQLNPISIFQHFLTHLSVTQHNTGGSALIMWRKRIIKVWHASSTLFFFLKEFLYFYYLFIYFYFQLCWIFVSVQGLSLVAASGGHSSLRCAGLSLLRPLLLRSTGSRRAGSVVVAHGPSCSAACGIFPDQGSNPRPLHWQADSQPLRRQGSPILLKFKGFEKFWEWG